MRLNLRLKLKLLSKRNDKGKAGGHSPPAFFFGFIRPHREKGILAGRVRRFPTIRER